MVAQAPQRGPEGPPGPQGPDGPTGPEGPAGATGATGARGATGDQGAAGPQGSQGAKGDKGDTGTTGSAGAAGATGPAGPTGPTGAAGSAGAAGGAGPAGVDGRTILSGSGAPSSGAGVNGDYYLDTTAHAIYGPKTAGAWGSPTSLVGPTGAAGSAGATGATGPQGTAGATGATGSAGAAGADGKTVRSGSGAPSSGLGVDGDFYIDTTAHNLYGPKTSGVWGSATSLVGPTGATGSAGAAGSTGATGPTGAAGAAGADGRPAGAVAGDTFMVPEDPRNTATAAVFPSSTAIFVRWTCPKSGTLAGLAFYCGTSSGNFDIGIYDSGDADTTKLTPLYRKTSTATASGWNTAAPGISVVAGRDYHLALVADNATATCLRSLSSTPVALSLSLPSGFGALSGGATQPRLAAQRATSFPLPAAFATSDLAQISGAAPPIFLARVT